MIDKHKLGIYVHIPFCRQFCYYCDFYKSANFRYVPDFVKALNKEIRSFEEDTFVSGHSLKIHFDDFMERSVYFGGGTPSVLSISQLSSILDSLKATFSSFDEKLEMTIEVNPEDTSLPYYQDLIALGFDRVSIGVQSFNNNILNILHRKHSGETALRSIEDARKAGFENISIDLIYGIPGQRIDDFANDLAIFFDMDLEHLSAYHLSIEDYTEFGRRLKKKQLQEVSEELSNQFYDLLISSMRQHRYDHYEISNFAKTGYRSRHNSGYWRNYPYIGFGPSAHSYDATLFRFFNAKPVQDYINLVLNDLPYKKQEKLSMLNVYNEIIINSLRTKEGLDIENLYEELSEFSSFIPDKDYYVVSRHFHKVLQKVEEKYSEAFSSFNPNLKLKERYYLVADYYVEKLMIDPDESVHFLQ